MLGVVLACACTEAHPHRTSQTSVTACGLRFSIPAGWHLRPGQADVDADCAAELRLDSVARSADSTAYTLSLRTTSAGFAAAADGAGFQRKANGWIVLGRQGMEGPAEEAFRGDVRVVKGIATIGWFDETGRYAGLAEVPSAVICRAETCLLVVGGPAGEDAFDLLLASVRFPPR